MTAFASGAGPIGRLVECGFGRLADLSVRQPLSRPVPANDAVYRAGKGLPRLAFRSARRRLLLGLSGQRGLLRERLDPAWRRLLWVHEGMPQIGDALMDLAPRSLLAERGLAVDLFAAPHVAALFDGDPAFQRVFSDAAQVDPARYDAVLLLGNDPKSLRLKRARLPALPWLSLHGFYSGPDFQRARFATQRLADLLRIELPSAEFAAHARQKLQVDPAAARWAAGQCPQRHGVALALGGVWPERTYHRWPDVAVRLVQRGGVRRLLLLGHGDGAGAEAIRATADAVAAAVEGRAAVLDFVGRTDLRQAHALLDCVDACVCADGGLMHLAVTTRCAVVALFTSRIAPAWRLPDALLSSALVSPGPAVDGIAPDDIADRLLQALADGRPHA